MSKQLSRKQGHTGVITTAAAQAESMMLRPHNAAASRWLHFVATTQRRRKSQTALCGDHMTLPQALTALCGDHMTLPQALTALCGDHMTLPQTRTALCGDHMTLPQATKQHFNSNIKQKNMNINDFKQIKQFVYIVSRQSNNRHLSWMTQFTDSGGTDPDVTPVTPE